MTKIYKLELFGHVHNRPNHLVSSYYSNPRGYTVAEAVDMVQRFSKAFALTNCITPK